MSGPALCSKQVKAPFKAFSAGDSAAGGRKRSTYAQKRSSVQACHASGNSIAGAAGSTPAQPCTGSLAHLPGDPGLMVFTNVDLGGKKREVMKHLSSSVASCLGKPESFVAVMVQDKQDVIFAGSDEPCALATLTSLGSINRENNEALSSAVAEALGEFGVANDRYYLNCFDVPRENCGFKGKTFAS